MKEEDFLSLVGSTGLSKASREAARLVYVEGLSQADAGERCNLSKQRMHAIVARVRQAELERQAPAPVRGGDLVAVVEASYAFAVKAAREECGDEVGIRSPASAARSVGRVLARTDFHLVQAIGRGEVMVHELAKLDKVPAVGKQVAIQYEGGRGSVTEQQRQREGKTR